MADDALTILARALSGGGEHVVFIAPQPDDETITAGITISRVMRASVIHVTGGANGGSRARDARAALALAGVESVFSLDAAGVSENLGVIAEKLTAMLDRLKPDLIVTCAYKNGHPDHEATTYAVSLAARVPVAQLALSPTEESILHLELSEYERTLKKSMIGCLKSSREVLSPFPVLHERFRNAPLFDFDRYASLGWGMRVRSESLPN